MNSLTDLHYGRGALYEYFYIIFSGAFNKNFIGLSRIFGTLFENMEEVFPLLKFKESSLLLFEYSSVEEKISVDEVLHILQRQFSGLYLVGACGITPTESVYLSAEGINRQEPWSEVKEIYAKRGFSLPVDFKEPEDHIGAELLFMSRMSCLTADLLNEGNRDKAYKAIKEQLDFINKHLGRWTEPFCRHTEILAQERKAPLFAAAAKALTGYINYVETQTLQEILNQYV